MTGESLLNGQYDVMAKRIAQGSELGLDQFFQPGIRELLAVTVIFIICAYLWHRRHKRL